MFKPGDRVFINGVGMTISACFLTSFKVGDTVTLKSGGMKMTVTEIRDNKIFCSFFESRSLMSFNQQLTTMEFQPECLKKVEES